MTISPADLAELCTSLTELEADFLTDAQLCDFTTFRLGGPCPVLIQCQAPNEVTRTVRTLVATKTDFLFIGGGSNLVVSDRGLDTPVIRFVSEEPDITIDGTQVTVSGGTVLDDLAAACVEAGLEGIVKTSGVPGTVGGAIAGNAGAFGWQMGDALTRITLINRQGQIREATPEEIGFSYRDSGIKHSGDIVLSATLDLVAGDENALQKEREDILALRKEKHPDIEVDSCAGSFFRNIEPTSKAERRQAAGYFLEQAGAKDMRIGGAGVFPKHANIIVKADDSCTAQDIVDLQARMSAAVKEMFDIDLVREVRLIGEFR